MRTAALCLIVLGSGWLNGQDKQQTITVRSIVVKLIPTGGANLLPIPFTTIDAAWRSSKVNLEVENRLDVASVEKAKEVIRQIYATAGHVVEVGHILNHIPPRSVEVEFQVVAQFPPPD